MALLLMLLATGMLYNQNALKLVRIFQSLVISTCKQSCPFFFCNADTNVLTSNQKKPYLAAVLEILFFKSDLRFKYFNCTN